MFCRLDEDLSCGLDVTANVLFFRPYPASWLQVAVADDRGDDRYNMDVVHFEAPFEVVSSIGHSLLPNQIFRLAPQDVGHQLGAPRGSTGPTCRGNAYTVLCSGPSGGHNGSIRAIEP